MRREPRAVARAFTPIGSLRSASGDARPSSLDALAPARASKDGSERGGAEAGGPSPDWKPAHWIASALGLGAAATSIRLLQPEIAQRWVIVRPSPQRPMALAVAVANRGVVDAGEAATYQAARVELPKLVAVGTEPIAAVVTPFISEADGDTVFTGAPHSSLISR